jgi:hypothetical protein
VASNVAFTGFSRTDLIDLKKPYGTKRTLKTETNINNYNDFLILRSLPERFINQKHPERLELVSFKTRKHQILMLNGQLLDINNANKDVVAKVVKLLRNMKKEKPDIKLRCFIEENFLNKMLAKKNQPATKQILEMTGRFIKNVGRGFIRFFT